ncbi:efflux RND transporter periplasmic adaptor subunit [Burkholderia thailandensis]|uniref:efflux RND transporter periplasmic adaptor subunit n=1 Tax=Burkholderia thailandensis TaxID=57975 RepID=UPI00016A75B3|nr:efflux RND transporter periplasmic adaptor subunit [Burkholderia thailandensis]AHI82496.1 efflux transporter, RND family, MFP subunit [Burkholderia thailandensis E444]AIC91205.1 efflux transporter, RND family, MFP subunit [Burkholderia thailandensis USAMRU Malaysia \
MTRAGKGQLLFFVSGALAVALALGYAFWPAPIVVDTAKVTTGPLRVTIDEDGEIRAHDRYVVTAPITGRLLRVMLREGDRVRAGEVIAVLVPVPMTPGENAQQRARVEAAEASLREAQARVAHTRADLAQARRERERGQTLVDAGAISRQSMEQLRAIEATGRNDLDAASAREKSAAAEVRAATANLEALEAGLPVKVRSPVDAVLLRVDEKSERVVPAGTAIMLLADPSRYEVVIDVLSTDAVKISPGMRVSVEDWGGTAPIDARVRVVEPGAFTKISALGVEEQRVHVVADLSAPPGRLSDGYRVQGRIVIWERMDVLSVPVGALFRCAEQWCVFEVDHGRAIRHVVQIGQRNAEAAQVLDGLQNGKTVVVYPPTTLAENTPVRLRQTE